MTRKIFDLGGILCLVIPMKQYDMFFDYLLCILVSPAQRLGQQERIYAVTIRKTEAPQADL